MQNDRTGRPPPQAEQLTGVATGVASPATSPPRVLSAAWKAGDVVLGDYLVERELGQGVGGMGRVYLLSSPNSGARYAVKRSRQLDREHQRKFIFELLTWADLPPHPNLLPFRFARTEGDEVFLFSDYAEGGSMADWIREGRLRTLEQILDVTIQLAWGLHVAHEHGIVHQDVKPSNALMTADGRVMVGDFGLARSRPSSASRRPDNEPPDSLCVSHRGQTPAYCSPEQARKEHLTRRTDVWSWGVSVLEAFTGRVTWALGTCAPAALEDYVRRQNDPTLLAIPEWLVEVLRRCFQPNPAQRWPTMAAIIDAVWTGSNWDSDNLPALAAVPAPPEGVVAHDRAIDLLERLVGQGRIELANDLAAACLNKAVALRSHGRGREALPLYDQAIDLLARLVEQGGRSELANALAGACMEKTLALQLVGEGQTALPLYDRAIGLLERLVQQGRGELANALATACMSKGVALDAQGEGRAALPLYDRAIGLLERLVQQEGRAELVGDLARVRLYRIDTQRTIGDAPAELTRLVRENVDDLRRDVERSRRDDLARVLRWAEQAFRDLP